MNACKHGHVDGVMHIACPHCRIESLEAELAQVKANSDDIAAHLGAMTATATELRSKLAAKDAPALEAVPGGPILHHVVTAPDGSKDTRSGQWDFDALRARGYTVEPVYGPDRRKAAPAKQEAAPLAAVPEAARDVLAERQRQKDLEGWAPEHDDKYFANELARAAACYAVCSETKWSSHVPQMWPWSPKWWKPTTERRNLVKAGALILAEIERLDRLATKQSPAAPLDKETTS